MLTQHRATAASGAAEGPIEGIRVMCTEYVRPWRRYSQIFSWLPLSRLHVSSPRRYDLEKRLGASSIRRRGVRR